ncbi:MAG: site-specific integrase [Phycisphaerales bacterium]|nr:site-specific integrase [Phycisphaerales bacterium]MCB9855323.1 site-specific integrase [Phycisphaerales bacterium]MCB9862916.1 site-specific integrase [Phycisphaerales bacterium]
MKQSRQIGALQHVNLVGKGGPAANVKSSAKRRRYERFGETIRYLTIEELQQFLDAIEDDRHKLMMRVIYELGCRVGEFVRIQLRHLTFSRSTVYFPAENTKTTKRRVSHLPPGLMNDIKSMLRREGRMAQRSPRIHRADDFLFHPGRDARKRYTENRLRQIFARYIRQAGLDRQYARDRKGRALHELTIHSLRHSHIMHYVHIFKLPLPIVQKQVGHTTLSATSVYLRPSDEHVGSAYELARRHSIPMTKRPQALNTHAASSFDNDTKNRNPKTASRPA